MKILLAPYPLANVNEDAAGGAEQIVASLDRELNACGHTTVMVAREGSHTYGELLPLPAVEGELTSKVRTWIYTEQQRLIDYRLHWNDVDLVHMHAINFHRFPPGYYTATVLGTMHLPAHWYEAGLFNPRPRTYYNFVSESQRAIAGRPELPVVPNGIHLPSFHVPATKQDYALAIGRVCPEKGFEHALDAAHRAGSRMLLAGEVHDFPEHRAYFDECVRPLLDARREFIGHAGFARKRQLLADARCVLIPSVAPETSSLVAMEALASGTPVIAFAAGALPEVVEHGRTGFIVRDAAEMAEAIARVDEIDPQVCRRTAELRFCSTLMAERYVALYESILQQACERVAA